MSVWRSYDADLECPANHCRDIENECTSVTEQRRSSGTRNVLQQVAQGFDDDLFLAHQMITYEAVAFTAQFGDHHLHHRVVHVWCRIQFQHCRQSNERQLMAALGYHLAVLDHVNVTL